MFVLVSDIIELVRKVVNIFVIKMDGSVFLLVEVLLKNLSDIFPLCHEFFSFLRLIESSIDL